MKEKLEQEAVSFCYDNGINISPRQATNIANYFYNLALADVRGDVEKRKAVNEHFNLDERVLEDVHILYFIDNLTK